jgi:7-cyano-7-deazaguanine synthase in queuosine biosynthesis
MRRGIVGFSGGVTSAWCAGWALRNFPREEVVLQLGLKRKVGLREKIDIGACDCGD